MDDLRKSLDIFTSHNMRGEISDEILSKACESYKNKIGFTDSYDYHFKVSKSLFDHLNNVSQSDEINKAIIPGQTKIVDGVMYIYTQTPNAQTQYDWRVYKGSKKVGKKVSDDKLDAKQKFVNDMFPDANAGKNLKVIKKLGGSTGAKLVEDTKGNQYVLKRGSNTSNEHVENEYIANQLYNLLGVRVPDFEMYKGNTTGDNILLSKFIPLTTTPTSINYADMAKGFVVDALLANWDVYQNDNCLVDSSGRIIRVDNGGTMSFRAQGGQKSFGSKVSDFDSMRKYNPQISSLLTDQDFVDQINEVVQKKDDVINYLKESGKDDLARTFEGRFKDLLKIRGDLEGRINRKNRKVLPRKLKSPTEMYRKLTHDEVNSIYNSISGNYRAKLRDTSSTTGWVLLQKICNMRGFDNRPLVVDDQEYWNSVSKSKYQMFRGVSGGYSNTAEDYADDFKYNDSCFYGNIGVHGSGIYAHVNDGIHNKDNTPTDYKKSDAYGAARGYSGSNGAILELCLDPSAKVAFVDDLRKEVLGLIDIDVPEVEAKNKEINDKTADLTSKQNELDNITQTVEDDVKKSMNWDSNVLVTHQVDVDSVDWGKVDEDGHEDYPSFDEFVVGKVFDWVKLNGGNVTQIGKRDDVYTFKLPNSSDPFTISRYQWENNAIKRKNAFSVAYNYPLKRFQNWLMKEHYQVIQKVVDHAKNNIGDKVTSLQKEVHKLDSELKKLYVDLSTLKQAKAKDPNSDIYQAIYTDVQNGNDEAIGVYAAIKGYDAIMKPRGNSGPNTFGIILNRTKIIVKK